MATPDVKTLADDDLDSLMARLQEEKRNREEEKRQQILNSLEEKAKELKAMAAEVGMSCKIEISTGGKGRSTTVRNKVPPKYKNPDNENEVWTGRGNKPRWVAAQLAAGFTMDDLLISKG